MNHWQKWAMAILGGVALAAALALAAVGNWPEGEALALAPGTIYVDVDATGGANDGSSWEDAYTTLQPALDEAVAGDEIWVAEGIYTPTQEFSPGDPRSATFQLKNGVSLYGGFDPSVGDVGWEDRDWVNNVAILSGNIGDPDTSDDNSYHVFYHPYGWGGNAILDGVTVTGGNADGTSPHDRGGGMHNTATQPTIQHCTFKGNRANFGGGIANYSSSADVTDCTFSQNEATTGGGIANTYGSSGRITDSRFLDNVGGTGGGMYNDHSSPWVVNCLFADNTAVSGGGLYNDTSASPQVVNSIFIGNTAASNGGGLMNYHATYPLVTNCTFLGNSGPNGGAIYDASSATIVTNSILWGDTPNEFVTTGWPPPTVTYSDVQGGYAGTGNIDLDPFLEDPAIGDVHLLPDSPCIDAGTNAALFMPDTDFEGDPRIWDGDGDGTPTADMGADEFAPHTLALHVAGNGSGTVEQTPEGSPLEHGTVVTLTAVADPSSVFTGWSGDAGGTTNPITLTMDTNKAVTATFTLDLHTLTIGYAGNGSGVVSLNPPGGSYGYGTIVTLTAEAELGSVFTGWSGDAGGTTNPITLTMDVDKQVTATFMMMYRVFLPLVVRNAP